MIESSLRTVSLPVKRCGPMAYDARRFGVGSTRRIHVVLMLQRLDGGKTRRAGGASGSACARRLALGTVAYSPHSRHILACSGGMCISHRAKKGSPDMFVGRLRV